MLEWNFKTTVLETVYIYTVYTWKLASRGRVGPKSYTQTGVPLLSITWTAKRTAVFEPFLIDSFVCVFMVFLTFTFQEAVSWTVGLVMVRNFCAAFMSQPLWWKSYRQHSFLNKILNSLPEGKFIVWKSAYRLVHLKKHLFSEAIQVFGFF